MPTSVESDAAALVAPNRHLRCVRCATLSRYQRGWQQSVPHSDTWPR